MDEKIRTVVFELDELKVLEDELSSLVELFYKELDMEQLTPDNAARLHVLTSLVFRFRKALGNE